jgi:hypothetical protein
MSSFGEMRFLREVLYDDAVELHQYLVDILVEWPNYDLEQVRRHRARVHCLVHIRGVNVQTRAEAVLVWDILEIFNQ